MQKITREQLIDKASELLSNGTVSCVLGWGRGEFGYDVTPTVFKTAEDMQANFVFNDFCGANFSKYLVSKTQKLDGKMLVFLKPCDTYSFNQLLTEHRFDKEKVYEWLPIIAAAMSVRRPEEEKKILLECVNSLDFKNHMKKYYND